MSLYDDLGLRPDASDAEIKAAHRRAAKRHHPDAGGKREDFERVQRAALILRDPDKRERYDRDGTVEDEATVDRELQGAVSLMNEVFQAALATSPSLERTDIIGGAKAMLAESIRHVEQQQAGERKAKAKFEKAAKRLRHKGKGPNMLGQIIADQITACQGQIERLALNLAAHKRASTLLDEYDWTVDAAPDWADLDISLMRGLTGSTRP